MQRDSHNGATIAIKPIAIAARVRLQGLQDIFRENIRATTPVPAPPLSST